MKPLKSFNLTDKEWTIINSKVCNVAVTLAYKNQTSEEYYRIIDLTSSYFNQWRFVIEAYEKLYYLFSELNKKKDQTGNERLVTDFDLFSLKSEIEFKNYSYLFITSLKSLLDLLVCNIDMIQNFVIRDEHKFPDFFTYARDNKKIEKPIEEIKIELDKLRNPDNNTWIQIVKRTRDKVIHRGYLLKPKIGFYKTESLIIQVYRGTDFYDNVEEFDVGNLFENFINYMPRIENTFSDILLKNVTSLNNQLTHEVFFQYSDLINQYNYKQIIAD